MRQRSTGAACRSRLGQAPSSSSYLSSLATRHWTQRASFVVVLGASMLARPPECWGTSVWFAKSLRGIMHRGQLGYTLAAVGRDHQAQQRASRRAASRARGLSVQSFCLAPRNNQEVWEPSLLLHISPWHICDFGHYRASLVCSRVSRCMP